MEKWSSSYSATAVPKLAHSAYAKDVKLQYRGGKWVPGTKRQGVFALVFLMLRTNEITDHRLRGGNLGWVGTVALGLPF